MGDLNPRGEPGCIHMGPEEGGREGGSTCLLARPHLAALNILLRSQCGSSENRGSCGVLFCSASNSCLIVAPKNDLTTAYKNVCCARQVQEWYKNYLVLLLHRSDLVKMNL